MEEFKKFDRQLLKNCSNLIFNKYGRHIPVPDSDAIYARRDYVNYRLGASFQQLGFLIQIADSQAKQYESVKGDSGDKILFTMKAIKQVSYCLDNLIFNLASMSDYVGNYLGLLIYGPNFQTIKWKGLVNKTNEMHREHEFGKLLSSEHKDWFTRLHGYRGDIIHKKAIMVEVEGFTNTRMLPDAVDSLNFIVNDSLKRYFHMIRNKNNMSVVECAHRFAERTITGLSNLLRASETLNIRSKNA